MVECQEAPRQLLVARQKLAEAIEPAVANLYHPASGFFTGVTPLDVAFLPMSLSAECTSLNLKVVVPVRAAAS